MRLNEAMISELTSRLERKLDGCGPLPVAREDLIGEVLLRLLAAENGREIRNPLAYATTILKNLIRDHLRRAERGRRAIDKLAASREACVPGLEEADRLDDQELINFLLERTQLSPLQEKVLRMVYLRAMKLSEVARELSRNPGTILRHLNRALAKLEECAAELELQ